MTQEQKLKACFDWVIKKPYVMRRKFVNEPGWPALYANDHFLLGGGNCESDACAFAYLAKAIGYTNIYVCTDSDGTWGLAHSWRRSTVWFTIRSLRRRRIIINIMELPTESMSSIQSFM